MDAKTAADRITRTPQDPRTMEELIVLLRAMPEAEIERFYRGTFNVLAVADLVLQERFPLLHARIAREIDDGDEPMKV